MPQDTFRHSDGHLYDHPEVGFVDIPQHTGPRSITAERLDLETLRVISDAQVDVTGAQGVHVHWNAKKTVIWVDVNGVNLLRICQIESLVIGDTPHG